MRLSRDLDRLKPQYDAVVVGSGYGAGVAASRLARMGLSVAVLERGREIPVGEFPDNVPEATAELQYTHDGRRFGRRTSLFDLHFGRDMHVLVGCGLGGTSLINANVSLPPDGRVWEDPRWPAELFGDNSLNEGFARAKAMLRPVPYPEKLPPLAKLERMAEAARRLEVPLERPPINVTFETGVNAAGVEQPACTRCGDCCSGCNVGAKTTVQMTYLPDAFNHGAEIFTEASVTRVARDGGDWRIFYRSSSGRDTFQTPERSITAHIVALGAGALGSTEILLRSKAAGLAVSDRLGQGFTGNGDVLAFAYNGQKPVNGVGIGVPPKANVEAPGPCIAGLIDLRAAGPLEDGMVIEEGVLPSGLAEALPAIFNTGGRLFGKDTSDGILDEFQESVRRTESWVLGAWRGAMHNTSTFLVMAHDDGAGRLALDGDHISVAWPDVARQKIFERIESRLIEVTTANNATFIRNPIQNTFLGKNLITVHPLGGCGMGPDAARGVVDHKCRVYDASQAAARGAVHEGLYVVDGAAVPRPLGVNPLLTITALAERAMIHLAKDIDRTLDTARPSGKPVISLTGVEDAKSLAKGLARSIRSATAFADISGSLRTLGALGDAARQKAEAGIAGLKAVGERAVAAATESNAAEPAATGAPAQRLPAGVEFTERMAGFVSDRASADYDAAETVGRSFNNRFAFTVTVRIDDIDRFVLDPLHEGRFTGTAEWPQVSREPVDINNGIFRLMRRSPDVPETRLFEYEMQLTTREGRKFTARGHKNVHDDHTSLDLWKDTTTLFIDIVETQTGAATRGVLVIEPRDFARQVRTIRGFGGDTLIERSNAIAKFGALFAGTLFDVYGSVFAPVKRYNPARVRKKRGLRAGDAQVHYFTTADNKRLRLTRYNNDGANTKGPVLLTHGLGVSSLIFTIDTIDTNLVEYLCQRGYDCWLLDFRASIDLPYAKERWTGDDCAKFDYQPAVDLIRAATGAPSVQVMAHCFGSTTFCMAMLGGYLTGVRSAVISQIAADILVPFFPQRLLAFLRAPALFDWLKIDYVNARASTEDATASRLLDILIRIAVPFQREERSRNATSNRITALYGQLYEIDQLNALTFDAGLAEMFGEANIQAFHQLALLTRKTVLLDANGEDKYMPYLERMAFPIRFIHGAENACFKPESTKRTVEKLSARNSGRFYEHILIPNYGHIDCIFGKNAASDVYPKIYEHLERTALWQAVAPA